MTAPKRYFTTGASGASGRTGFIAWVDERPDGIKYLTVRGFEALAVEALRELRAEKDAELAELRARLAEQDEELARLRAEQERLTRDLVSRLAVLESGRD